MAVIDLSIKGKNVKSIGANEEGFESIYPINVIIGKNNSGKSTLLDLIHYTIAPGQITLTGHKRNSPEVFLTKLLSEQEIASAFPDNTSGGNIPGSSHREFGMRWLNKPITIKMEANTKTFIKTDPPLEPGGEYKGRLAQVFPNYLTGKLFRRIRADRDIVPERQGEVDVKDNGQGITNIIQTFYNEANRDQTLVTEKLLAELNKIFNPDVNFTEISVRRSGETYEIFLREENKGFIPLSSSGSGIKTVISVLVNLLLIPNYEGEPLSKYVFGFEELENNLHPGLQRRLFNYIRETAQTEGSYFFLTTHSNVVIDLFNKDENAQMIHVTHDGDISSVKKVITYSPYALT